MSVVAPGARICTGRNWCQRANGIFAAQVTRLAYAHGALRQVLRGCPGFCPAWPMAGGQVREVARGRSRSGGAGGSGQAREVVGRRGGAREVVLVARGLWFGLPGVTRRCHGPRWFLLVGRGDGGIWGGFLAAKACG
ncbi:hypothetical protein [Kibdelosporangium philippinense]|uniref:hypothetical protein n=1 Tax=Kibdelosporangium philippinense TaxID=211113 RepID=UPI003611FD9A